MTKKVPYLDEDQIERDTVALLAEFAQARGIAIEPPIPIDDIVEKHLKLGVEFDDMHRLFNHPRPGLGRDPEILGAMFFDDRRIVIDESLDPEENPSREGRYRFTLAHEGGGHWRLHRHLFAKDPGQVSFFTEPEQPSVICRSSQAKEPVEWQADFYASCLLMPRRLIFEAWRCEFGSDQPRVFDPGKPGVQGVRAGRWNGPRLIGQILSEVAEPDYVPFFEMIAKKFSPTFQVSTQAMRIRLEKLGLLLHGIPRQRALGVGA